ncbi:non-ribosomal peptide synthetase [Micromonospora carbonacea]|uniref:Amino acid adenylation domain-containing protein n=1 Tax=Micromonospora carbonacea TaxID=47853 RepID=A0A7H8XK06_9ACTN|nr:amino acid adenylation domain-containing protein [Micromonospora carbonacea]MBB5826999.1 amino acid adenylation domain-containing protein [Micromonospora carbonacea]QLD25175.1 amino acid adenylation domain-containing protein [Micromonospora carbonacea]
MPVGFADGAVDAGGLDLVGDLRRVVGWPARAGSVSGVVSWPVGVVGSGVVVVAGLVGVLARYTGQSEVVLGLAGGGVVRVDVAGDPGFGELAGRVEAALASPAADGRVDRVVVGLADGPLAEVGPDVVDAGLVVWVAGDGSGLRVDFAVEEFSAGWARGFVDAVVTLVSAGVAGAQVALSGLTLVSVVERERLLGWGRGPVREVPGAPIHELVLEWAQRSPEAVAGVAGGVVLTYGELARRSAVVAGFLRSVGVGSGDVVSLALDRSLWTLVAALGVLRAGAAYTPMDVAWPAERMRVLLADHGARVVLTVGEVASRVPCPDGVRVVALDEQWPRIEAVGPVDLPAVTVDGPAFVIYTSGSTGTPKGVVLTHEKLTNFLAWMADECAIGPDSRMLHSAAPVFDAAFGEVFATLISGGQVVVCSRDDLLDVRRLTGLIGRHGVTHTFGPATNVAPLDPAACPSLRCVVLGGEAAPPQLVRRWSAAGARVVNAYGPAEAAVACTWYDASTGWPGSYVPIGWPMPNRQIHIVDPHLNLVPAGAPGEILITGHGIADGYLHRPELTTQRFVTDPHTHQLAYRTGDLARWNSNGALEILGRIDHQIKINGIRIELGEIETTLEQHPDVTTAIVTRRDDNDTPRLIGYVTARDGRTPTPEALREHAATILPSYMVPAVVMVLDRFPVGGTGKIDRAALPAPDGRRPDLGVDYAAPATAQERLVTGVFATVLGIDRVGVHDSFFDLGGTSLQSAAVATGIDEAADVVVPVSQIHRTPTPHALAAWLATAPRRTGVGSAVGHGRQRPGPVPLAQQVAKCLMSPPEVVVPVSWWVEGDLDLRALMAALGDLHRRHEALHARYRRVEPPVALVPANPGMPQLLLLTDAATTQDALDQLADAVQQPLDYTQGRNWRTAVIRDRSTNRTLLGIGIHHIAFDGWSHTLLVRDLTHAYTARKAGHPPAWDHPAPTLRQIHDEYARLRTAADLPAQRAYWRTQLHGLPRQGDGGPTVSLEQALAWGPKAGHTVTVPAEVMQRWDRAAREHRFSRSSYFVAAFATALRAIHHQDDIGLLMVVAKRGSRVLDSAFTTRLNLNCVRVRFDGPQDDKLVLRVHETIADLMRAQDVPFAETADDPAAGLSSEVVASLPTFVYQDNLVLPLELPGCRTEEVVDPYAREVSNGLTVEVLPRADHALLRVTIRTDYLPYRLAEELNGHMLRFLEGGPAPAPGR